MGGGRESGEEGSGSQKARLEMYGPSLSNKLKLSQADLDSRSRGPPSGPRSWRDLQPTFPKEEQVPQPHSRSCLVVFMEEVQPRWL